MIRVCSRSNILVIQARLIVLALGESADVAAEERRARARACFRAATIFRTLTPTTTTVSSTTPNMTPNPLLRVLERHVIYDLILDLCPITTVLRFKRVCRTTNAAVTDYMERTLDINKHLSHFFKDPKAFRVVQARTGALVANLDALAFLGRFDSREKRRRHLDVFVAGANATIELCQWLNRTGHCFKGPWSSEDKKKTKEQFDAESFLSYWSDKWPIEDAPDGFHLRQPDDVPSKAPLYFWPCSRIEECNHDWYDDGSIKVYSSRFSAFSTVLLLVESELPSHQKQRHSTESHSL